MTWKELLDLLSEQDDEVLESFEIEIIIDNMLMPCEVVIRSSGSLLLIPLFDSEEEDGK
jgi:hypothetical protein